MKWGEPRAVRVGAPATDDERWTGRLAEIVVLSALCVTWAVSIFLHLGGDPYLKPGPRPFHQLLAVLGVDLVTIGIVVTAAFVMTRHAVIGAIGTTIVVAGAGAATLAWLTSL